LNEFSINLLKLFLDNRCGTWKPPFL
jgi:hypothetical protein